MIKIIRLINKKLLCLNLFDTLPINLNFIKMFKYSFTIFFLLIAVKFNFAQSKKIDSLFNFYLNKSFDVTQYNPQKGLEIALKTAELAEKLNNNQKKLSAFSNISYIYQTLSAYKEALNYSMKHYEIAVQLNDSFNIADAYNNISSIYFNLNEFDNAYYYSEKSTRIFENLKNYNALGNTYNNMAIQAEYLEKFDLADSLYKKSLFNFLKDGDTNDIALSYMNYADFIVKSNRFDEALAYQKKALDYFNKANNQVYICYTYMGVANNFLQQNKFQEALLNIQKSIEIAKKLNILKELATGYSLSSKIYKGLNNFILAYEYLDKSNTLKDSILSSEEKNLISQLQIAHETKTKENKIELLNKEKEFQNSIISKNKIIITVMTFSLIILAVLVFLILNQLKTIKKSKKIIEHQNIILEEKQKEILDSFHYAKRIQQSLLTSEYYIQKNLTRLRK